MAPFIIYAFATTHDALVAERALIGADVPHMTIPTPKCLGALCGIAVRVPVEASENAETTLTAAGCGWTARAEMMDRVI